jgi:KipI family sensor histidine kinase inhibitor
LALTAALVGLECQVLAMLYSTPRLAPMGDAALLVEFASSISAAAYAQVQAAHAALARLPDVELVPAYASLLVCYPPEVSYGTIRRRVLAALRRATTFSPPERPLITIPTRYGGADGPDLPAVAALHGISEAEVVGLHTASVYTVYMLGFAPGFAYLGSLPPQLDTPRLAIPRLRVPAGSVGLAGRQTGIYALSTPGGWQIIGRTDLPLWEATREPPTLLRPGDRVRFAAK